MLHLISTFCKSIFLREFLLLKNFYKWKRGFICLQKYLRIAFAKRCFHLFPELFFFLNFPLSFISAQEIPIISHYILKYLLFAKWYSYLKFFSFWFQRIFHLKKRKENFNNKKYCKSFSDLFPCILSDRKVIFFCRWVQVMQCWIISRVVVFWWHFRELHMKWKMLL